MTDRTLERTNPDWSLYVADFDDWVSARLHVRPTARLKVEQQRSPHQGELVVLYFSPHCQLYIPRAIASRLRELLDALFSAGVSEGFASAGPVDGMPMASTAPAEPTKETP